MHELLRDIDPDHYRKVRLHIVRLELEQLRRERLAWGNVDTGSPISLGISRFDGLTARNPQEPRLPYKEGAAEGVGGPFAGPPSRFWQRSLSRQQASGTGAP